MSTGLLTAAVRRLQKELGDFKSNPIPGFHDLKVDEANILSWELLVAPTEVPYNKGAFLIQIVFPDQYPFKPPVVTFKTKIYHPNVDENGKVCLTTINPDYWKPATKVTNVLMDLLKLINTPEPEHPLRADLAEEFVKNHAKFIKSAEAFTKKHAAKRP